MANQTSHTPSTPSQAQITTRETTFLTVSRRLAAQPKPIPRIVGKPRQKPLAARPLQIKVGQSMESAPLPKLSSESKKKRRDDREVFRSILSNMEKEGGLPEVGVVNQPLPSEEEMEEASRRSALAVSDPKETAQVESYVGPIRVALEEEVAEKQPKMVEKKKNKKIKEKRTEGDKEAYPWKEKKERKTSENRERRWEEKRLKKKEEKRMRAESLEVDEESTSARGDEKVSAP
ncbi:protein PXR1-like [Benincasa hispida]|uniref:protein PXR1-like n=1 Tax=Benincasa hispida TaxID=102211 RepID=UPI0018FF970E|nr:protein PXR1-like [Benincasa hispida]